MAWKDLSSWLKGGIIWGSIGLGIAIILTLLLTGLSCSLGTGCSFWLIFTNRPNVDNNLKFQLLGFIAVTFIIGSIIGKLKNKKGVRK